jgi:spore coat polysaccharide biosynthesis protein SpsF (cytidylyltransferase family)
MSARAVIILQARMGSSRLPGKVLTQIAGRSVLAHCIQRLVAADAGEVIVATTTRPEDAAVVAEAQRLQVRAIRGPVDDVLGRFALAVVDWEGPYVIRATADNPVVDIDAPGRVLKVLDGGADYCVEEGLPVGAAVEGMRTTALRDAATVAHSAYDREHVTPYLKHNPGRYRVCPAPAPPECYRPRLRLTVDTREDFSYVKSLLEQAGADERLVPLRDVIALADRYASWPGVA